MEYCSVSENFICRLVWRLSSTRSNSTTPLTIHSASTSAQFVRSVIGGNALQNPGFGLAILEKNGNSLHTLRRPYYFNYREKVHRTTSKVSSLTWINISCIASLLGWRWRIYHGKILPCPKLRLRAVITKIVVVLVKWWKNVSFLYRMRVAPWRHWSWASRWQWYLNRQ